MRRGGKKRRKSEGKKGRRQKMRKTRGKMKKK